MGRKLWVITAVGENKPRRSVCKQAKCVEMRVKGAQSFTLELKSFWNTCIEEREGNNL